MSGIIDGQEIATHEILLTVKEPLYMNIAFFTDPVNFPELPHALASRTFQAGIERIDPRKLPPAESISLSPARKSSTLAATIANHKNRQQHDDDGSRDTGNSFNQNHIGINGGDVHAGHPPSGQLFENIASFNSYYIVTNSQISNELFQKKFLHLKTPKSTFVNDVDEVEESVIKERASQLDADGEKLKMTRQVRNLEDLLPFLHKLSTTDVDQPPSREVIAILEQASLAQHAADAAITAALPSSPRSNRQALIGGNKIELGFAASHVNNPNRVYSLYNDYVQSTSGMLKHILKAQLREKHDDVGLLVLTPFHPLVEIIHKNCYLTQHEFTKIHGYLPNGQQQQQGGTCGNNNNNNNNNSAGCFLPGLNEDGGNNSNAHLNASSASSPQSRKHPISGVSTIEQQQNHVENNQKNNINNYKQTQNNRNTRHQQNNNNSNSTEYSTSGISTQDDNDSVPDFDEEDRAAYTSLSVEEAPDLEITNFKYPTNLNSSQQQQQNIFSPRPDFEKKSNQNDLYDDLNRITDTDPIPVPSGINDPKYNFNYKDFPVSTENNQQVLCVQYNWLYKDIPHLPSNKTMTTAIASTPQSSRRLHSSPSAVAPAASGNSTPESKVGHLPSPSSMGSNFGNIVNPASNNNNNSNKDMLNVAPTTFESSNSNASVSSTTSSTTKGLDDVFIAMLIRSAIHFIPINYHSLDYTFDLIKEYYGFLHREELKFWALYNKTTTEHEKIHAEPRYTNQYKYWNDDTIPDPIFFKSKQVVILLHQSTRPKLADQLNPKFMKIVDFFKSIGVDLKIYLFSTNETRNKKSGKYLNNLFTIIDDNIAEVYKPLVLDASKAFKVPQITCDLSVADPQIVSTILNSCGDASDKKKKDCEIM